MSVSAQPPLASLPVIKAAGDFGQTPVSDRGPATDCEIQASEQLVELFRALPGVIIAFSGGVDSAVVAAAAVRALGPMRALAVTAVSPSLPAGELAAARQLAAELGIRHQVVNTDEGNDPRYRRNAGDRCFYCKTALYATIRRAVELPWPILNGTNAEDLGDFRPGLRAAAEASVRSPLAELNIAKSMVRAIARLWGLACHNKPAGPCLASRIAPGVAVTPERLAMIDAAECRLRQAGFCDLRVRLHADNLARIEVPADDLASAMEWLACPDRLNGFRDLGFRFVTLDLAGLRSGSMNELAQLQLAAPARESVGPDTHSLSAGPD
jgi:pyridinium-3,5-biscarboxylic acid mononucleotide sulfurtransferase